MRFFEIAKKNLIAFLYLLTVTFLIRKCPFFLLFHIPCPACGMTRAYLALLHGNIAEAFFHHPLFGLVPLLWLCVCIEPEHFSRHLQNIRLFILFFIALLFAARWLLVIMGN